MANIKVRSASLFINGKKEATIEGVDYEYSSGDEPQFGDPGYLGHSDGASTTTLSATGITPVAGTSTNIMAMMQGKQDFEISLALINAEIHQITMRCVKCKFTGSQKAGTLMGNYEFQGGEPKRA